MNGFENSLKPLKWPTALLLTALAAGCGGGGDSNGNIGVLTAAGAGTGLAGAGRGPAPVSLGTAGNFVMLAESAITNVPTSAITGDVGLSPAAGSFNGLACIDMVGASQIHAVDASGPAAACTVIDPALLTAAVNDKGLAYTDAAGRAPDYTELGAGDIGGRNLGPGTYKWSSAVLIPTNLTLTGGANDVWIFQIAQGLTVSSGVQITLAGGALPQNIYWQTFGTVALGTTSQFKGVILSQTDIAMTTLAKIDGRMFAGTAITLQQNTVTKP
jgi:hypothetical protein